MYLGMARAEALEPMMDSLERDHAMNETTNRFAPEGWHTVTPRIVAHDASQLVEFVRQVFGATGDYRPDRPSVIKIGDSVVMISNPGIRKRDDRLSLRLCQRCRRDV